MKKLIVEEVAQFRQEVRGQVPRGTGQKSANTYALSRFPLLTPFLTFWAQLGCQSPHAKQLLPPQWRTMLLQMERHRITLVQTK